MGLSAQWSPTPRFGTKKPQSSESDFRGLSVEPEVGEIWTEVSIFGDGSGDVFREEKGERGMAQENQEELLLLGVRVGVGGPASEIVELELMLAAELGRCCSSVTGIVRKADGNMVAWLFAGTSLDGLGDLELGVEFVAGFGASIDRDLECPW